jgi:glycosyltransferase involved in cell wall biosynthesis
MHDLGAPVIIGPMNGGMDYPVAFEREKGWAERLFIRVARELSHYVNVLIPGKRRAALLLVANRRTREALPRTASRHVVTLVENAVDLSIFKRAESRTQEAGSRTRFVFMGRLIDLKCVDLLIDAIAGCPESYELTIVGDGPMRHALEAQVAALGLTQRVTVEGQLSQKQCAAVLAASDALVLPSVRECGGAVVLEAMATGLPVIATNWGGPRDYLDEHTGILVEPCGRRGFTEGLREALLRLGSSPALRAQLGAAGRDRVEREFDWERKIDRILTLYAECAHVPAVVAPRSAPQAVGPEFEQGSPFVG